MSEKMKAIIAEQLSVNAEEIKPETNFKEDLGVDSLDLFEMVMAMEEEFGVEIPSEDLEKIATVNDLEEYLKAKGIEEDACSYSRSDCNRKLGRTSERKKR